MQKLEGSPILFFDPEETWADYAGRTDVLLLGLRRSGEHDAVCMPQFDIEVVVDEVDGTGGLQAAVERVVRELMTFYRALKDLPDTYVNEVEQAQLNIIEHTLFPWVFAELGRKPGYFALPPLDDDDLVSA